MNHIETPEDIQRHAECAVIDQVLAELAAQVAPDAWQRVERALRLTISLYSAGLARTLDHARAAGADPGAFDRLLADDDLVGKLLVLHGIHPLTAEQRLQRTVVRIRADLGLTEDDLVVVALDDGILELRATDAVTGNEELICRALETATPELVSIEIARFPVAA